MKDIDSEALISDSNAASSVPIGPAIKAQIVSLNSNLLLFSGW